MGTYAIAYTVENGNGFSNDEPWIEVGFERNLGLCKKRAAEMIEDGLQRVEIFQFGADLHETYSWNYVKEHRIDFEV